MLASALSSWRGVIKVRVNTRQNIVAADVSSRECLEKLLGASELCGIPVSARIPGDVGESTEYLHGVKGDLADQELLQCIESCVLVVSLLLSGNAVTLQFAGPVPPEYVILFKLLCWVRPARPRSLKCMQCRPPWSRSTSRKRITHSCRALLLAQPREYMHRPLPVHHALYQPLPASKPVPVRCQPSTTSNASLVTPAAALSTKAMPQLREDAQDAIIALLQLSMRAVGELLPSDSPMKIICLHGWRLQKTSCHHG
ncbi:hypothetical protein MRX96_012713 [Rhipicephalus microplus]